MGFRPFVYRLAEQHGLHGWVCNTPQGVIIDAEGAPDVVARLPQEIQDRRPALAHIHSLEVSQLSPVGCNGFEIRESDHRGPASALIMPDLATCPDCLREIFDPTDRRFRYAFTNCTNCGPRFTIISALPYDRPNTSMRSFRQCPECQREYDDPRDRRFHAQPNACPACGPRMQLWDDAGRPMLVEWSALERTAELVLQGKIVAVKSVGGFHLVCDAVNEEAVRMLRFRKHREEKPFALLMPSLEAAQRFAQISDDEAQLLQSTAAPIVLVARTPASRVFDQAVPVANPFLGLMLPSNPLQHLLMHLIDRPVVATSGNLTDEPICIDEREALQRLHGIADAFLVHNRPILRHADDSIVRMLIGRQQVLRRARGFAPLPLFSERDVPAVLGVGAHLKNSVAFGHDRRIVISQHLGDLETIEASSAFERAVRDLPALHGIEPEKVACDLHPDYRSSRHAHASGLPVVEVQHHLAHVIACMAENELQSPVLGVSWDGTGLGTDGTIWGGEFIRVGKDRWDRVATLRPFRLPGGDAAVKEPRRTALSVLYEVFGSRGLARTDIATLASFDPHELRPLRRMVEQGVRCPITTSAGRLFDAVASLVGLRHRVRHEGQAAMELEWAARASTEMGWYPLPIVEHDGLLVLDWRPMVDQIVEDVAQGSSISSIARRFHTTLAGGILDAATRVGISSVVLTGGCFQNGLLTEMAVERLRCGGFNVAWHQRIPPNDGGISAGQVMATAMGFSQIAKTSEIEATA